MIYVKQFNLVYYPIPKVACTSLKSTLAMAAGICLQSSLHGQLPAKRHLLIADGKISSLKKAPDRAFCFVFVRNPFDRLVSCYVDKVLNHGSGFPRSYRRRPFEAFVEKVTSSNANQANLHFRPQHQILENCCVHFVGRYERIEQDWHELCSHINHEIPLPHMNRSKRKPYKDYYTARAKTLAYKYYAEDLTQFGYGF